MLYSIPNNTERNIRTTHAFTKLSVVQKIVSVKKQNITQVYAKLNNLFNYLAKQCCGMCVFF